jgi:hypothetical protein
MSPSVMAVDQTSHARSLVWSPGVQGTSTTRRVSGRPDTSTSKVRASREASRARPRSTAPQDGHREANRGAPGTAAPHPGQGKVTPTV